MLTKLRRNPLFWSLALLIFGVGLVGCGGDGSASLDAQSPFVVESVFEEFYDFLGGQKNLGPALSPLIVEGEVQKQYFEAGLMVYDPDAPPSERHTLAPLGRQMGAYDEPLPNPNQPGVLFVEGYIVYEGFEDLYYELGGQRYVGVPLTGVRLVEGQNRVEQYFENLGFYLNLDDPAAGVQLMAYGRLACGDSCGSFANPAAINQIDLPYGEPFLSTVARVGDGLVGERIAGPYQNADGSLEVIYANMVFYANGTDASNASPRPILAMLGVERDAPVPRLDNPNVIFYGAEGELGYNIPLVFSDYIAQHGGFEVVGPPISEVKLLEDGSSRQCFSNACLRYFQGEVGPLAMGREYKARFYDQPAPAVEDPQEQIRILVWEERSQVNSSEEQVIYASVFAGTELLEGLSPYLQINLPDGGTSLYQFPPTDSEGRTQLTVPPVLGQNGTLVAYEVCLEGMDVGKVCARESYMIWGNP